MPIRAILAALIVAIAWGGNYSATKFALMDFPPFMLLLLRLAGVSLVLAPFVWRKPLPRWRDMLFIALVLNVLQFAGLFTAMHLGLSITTVVIAAQLGVPFACVLAAIFFKDYLGPWRSLGLMVAFMGVVIVAGTPNAASHWVAFLCAVLGALCWSVANIYLKNMKAPHSVVLLFWPALFSLPPLVVLTAIFETGQMERIQHAQAMSWAGLVYAVFISSLVGYGLWNWLVTRFPMSQVMPYGLLMPIAGISFGSLIFGEPLTMQVLLGGSLTIAGVAVISLRRPKLTETER